MGKPLENRIEVVLAKTPLDLTNVNPIRARGHHDEYRTLPEAVREALAEVPRVDKLNDAERASIVAWLGKHLNGKAYSQSAITAACSAALVALTLRRNADRAAVAVVVAPDVVAAAMSKATQVNAQRKAARAAKKPAAKKPAAKK
jgi:hypothetical protein